MSAPLPDISAMLAVVEEARVVDFMRYVNRQLRERPELAALPFRVGWNVLVGAYASTYAEPVDEVDAARKKKP